MRRKCTGAKHSTEIADSILFGESSGRGALPLQRRPTVKSTGAMGGENVGMSNRKSGESPDRRKPEVSSAMTIIGG
jgi:hypothetical protein